MIFTMAKVSDLTEIDALSRPDTTSPVQRFGARIVRRRDRPLSQADQLANWIGPASTRAATFPPAPDAAVQFAELDGLKALAVEQPPEAVDTEMLVRPLHGGRASRTTAACGIWHAARGNISRSLSSSR